MAADRTIMVVDDQAEQRSLLASHLGDLGYRTVEAGSGEEALTLLGPGGIDLVMTDLKMPGMDGLALLKEIKSANPAIPVVIITAFGTVASAVEAMKAGAADYLTKPIDLDEVELLVARILRMKRLEEENIRLKEQIRDKYRFEGFVSQSAAMEEVLNLVGRLAPTATTVLLRGESGTGKELLAGILHYNSPRAAGPFIKVNCTALPENLLESELFGHEKGAFTGAVSRRIGRFEEASGGTIFLDEIGDLTPGLQAKLLRVLQEREITRVGSNRPLKVDVRVIAATHRDLEAMLKDGSFREDLYYRLNVVPVFIPPLRSRKEDIDPLIDHFLGKYAAREGRSIRIELDARRLLNHYDYPGNVRELENIIERAVVLSREDVVTADDLPDSFRRPVDTRALAARLGKRSLDNIVEDVEKKLIGDALEKTGWVKSRAARMLGISERVIRYKMEKYRLAEDSDKNVEN